MKCYTRWCSVTSSFLRPSLLISRYNEEWYYVVPSTLRSDVRPYCAKSQWGTVRNRFIHCHETLWSDLLQAIYLMLIFCCVLSRWQCCEIFLCSVVSCVLFLVPFKFLLTFLWPFFLNVMFWTWFGSWQCAGVHALFSCLIAGLCFWHLLNNLEFGMITHV